jgi:hypothetical protein
MGVYCQQLVWAVQWGGRCTADRGEFDEELALARLRDGTVNLDYTVADFREYEGLLGHDAEEDCLLESELVLLAPWY